MKRRMIHCEQLLDRVLPFSAAGLLSLQSDSLDYNQRSSTDCATNQMHYWVIIGGHTWGIGGFSEDPSNIDFRVNPTKENR